MEKAKRGYKIMVKKATEMDHKD